MPTIIKGSDGLVDATYQVQKLFDSAPPDGEIIFDGGITKISGYVSVPAGIKLIRGINSAKISIAGNSVDAGIMIDRGRYGADTNPSKQLTITGLVFDCSKGGTGSTNPIHGTGVSNVSVVGNTIMGIKKGHGILFLNPDGQKSPTTGIKIRDNFISGETIRENPNPGWYGIGVMTQVWPPSPQYPQTWQENFQVTPSICNHQNNLICGNDITGGYYGISLYQCINSLIMCNRIRQNQRNISAQQCCNNNTFVNNTLEESLSSAIHLAYGACENRVDGNRIVANRAIGEGLLQSYVGSKRNIFDSNKVEVLDQGNPTYLAYVGCHSSAIFRYNQFIGKSSKAAIGADSAWSIVKESTVPTHRGKQDFFANGEETFVEVESNQFTSGSSTIPLIAINQISDSKGDHPMRVIVRKNTGAELRSYSDNPKQLQILLE